MGTVDPKTGKWLVGVDDAQRLAEASAQSPFARENAELRSQLEAERTKYESTRESCIVAEKQRDRALARADRLEAAREALVEELRARAEEQDTSDPSVQAATRHHRYGWKLAMQEAARLLQERM